VHEKSIADQEPRHLHSCLCSNTTERKKETKELKEIKRERAPGLFLLVLFRDFLVHLIYFTFTSSHQLEKAGAAGPLF
jgi:hypothetical protein